MSERHDWKVTQKGAGEASKIRVVGNLVVFSMSQAESRSLIDALSRVTLMPPHPEREEAP